MLRSSSEEITPTSISRKVLRSREKVTLDRIVRFIKVNAINIDTCFLQARKGMVSSKDQLLTICLLTPVTDDSRTSAAEMMSLSAVDVHDCNVSMKLKKLGRQLLSKKDTRSNDNDDTSIRLIKESLSVADHAHGLTAPSRDNDLTLGVRQHRISSTLLVGTELHQNLIAYEHIIAENRPWCDPKDGSRTVTKLSIV